MAKLVLAVGTSHGPTIQSMPDRWALLGERDTRDPRLDYQGLLTKAKPGLAQELERDVQWARHAAIGEALEKLADVVATAKLDIVVVVSNLHQPGKADSHPVFGILRAPRFAVAGMSEALFDPNAQHLKSGGLPPRAILAERCGHPELATYLVESLIGDGFDIACTDELAEGVALDDAFAFPDACMVRDNRIPMVPFLLSRDLPNQATAARCYDLGIALRRRIEDWPTDARIGLIASGGLSHQVVDEELDQRVVAALTGGHESVLRCLSRGQLNKAPGTPEILNWVTVAAAMAPLRMELVDYIPCYRSLAGTGHGVAFGYWV